MSPPDPRSTAALLSESAWLQRLALRLVSEPAGAADAAQETLTKALAQPPSRAVPLRRWLAAVLRNVVRQERRASARREARELARPLAPDGEPADALAERLELHEKLVAAVRGLAEPYRTTVALRFLEDLAPPAVAARMGVPLKTVHTRLERALALLRERLDREHGGRATWMRVWLPLVPVPPPPVLPGPALATPLLAPLLAMSTLWKWTGACAALVALGFLAVRALDDDGPRAARPTTAAEPATATLVAPAPEELPPAPPSAREAVAPERPASRAAEAPAAVPPAPAVLVGFVRDLEQRPVAGLTVGYERIPPTLGEPDPQPPAPGSAESDGDGRFELPELEGTGRIVAGGRGYATIIAPVLADPRLPEAPVVFVAPEASYAGRVVDEQGAPIAAAELGIYLERELARSLTPGTFVGAMPLARQECDADGRFAFPSVGAAPGSRLSVWAAGYQAVSLDLAPESSRTLLVTLEPTVRDERTLSGSVVFADGRPAAGAYVSVGGVATRARDDGEFELALETDAERVRAVLPGFLPAERELGVAGEELVLVLGEAARTIAGRVLDAAGQPVSGARVWTTDGQRFGEIETRLGEINFNLTYDVEGVIAGPHVEQKDGRRARSDAQGAFELTGLLDRRYELWVMHPQTLELSPPELVSSGSAGVVLTLAGEPARRVAGRVTTLGGEPIAKAKVTVARERRASDGSVRTHRSELEVETDEQGRFAFEALCVEGTRLLVSTTAAPSKTPFPLAEQPELEELELAVAAPCHLRVILADPASADSLGLLDEREQGLFVTFQLGGILCSATGVQIEGGVSDVLMTDERARTLVLRKGGEEIARLPLHLVPGEINEIRP